MRKKNMDFKGVYNQLIKLPILKAIRCIVWIKKMSY